MQRVNTTVTHWVAICRAPIPAFFGACFLIGLFACGQNPNLTTNGSSSQGGSGNPSGGSALVSPTPAPTSSSIPVGPVSPVNPGPAHSPNPHPTGHQPIPPGPTPTEPGKPKPEPSCPPGLVPAETVTVTPIAVDANSVEGTAAERMIKGTTVWHVKYRPGDCVSP
jgi:hypothetical protein